MPFQGHQSKRSWWIIKETKVRSPHPSKAWRWSDSLKVPSLSARRLQVLQYIIGALQKLAATRDIAIVVLTQCATKVMQVERGATLVPAINASVWEQGVSTRLVLYRNLAFSDAKVQGLRLVGVQKLNGKTSEAPVDTICAFDIEEVYLLPTQLQVC